MSEKFRLSQTSVNNMMSVYEDNANEVAEALKTYQLSLESVLGTGWKGKAAEKFTAIIEEYEKTTQEFISKINSFKGLMEQCGGKYTLLDSEAKKLNEQNKNGDVDGLYNG